MYVATYAIYTDPADDARYSDWVHRRTAELAAACGTGVYLGDTDFTQRQDRFARGARPVMPPCPAPEPGVRMAFVADPEGNLVELLDRGRKQ